jgi:hypothetical protein
MPKLEAGKARPNARPGWEVLLLLLIANPSSSLWRKRETKGSSQGRHKEGASERVSWGTERQRAGRRVRSRQERDADAVKGGPPLCALSNETESGGWACVIDWRGAKPAKRFA